ncbi:uncharacterized protein LOC116601948 [Nematostella vectensis]|uniref:uncharacterized protein LOC116601948 n=1 Tax=Nematostella vectensis TaxID=45351 RepID=UPI0020772D73|nr:uncharacterized protein LOC116601948 [Nematostella vectensis]
MNEDECIAEFRMRKQDIPIVVDALQLPATIQCSQRTICDADEALCMLLRRFCYPCRYSDLIGRFGRPVPELCMITNTLMDYIFDNHCHRISQWNYDILNPPMLQEYADAIFAKGAPLSNCFGFVDGTVRPISRPGQNQRIVYNGHKRVHSLKFQSVALPNGLIGHMYGPVEGKRHDAFMLMESNILHEVENNAFSPTGQAMCMYGDPAYPLRVHLQTPFRNGVLTPMMEEYNSRMSSVRSSVEWLFGEIINDFKFLDFKKNLKLNLSCVGKMYLVCALLENVITCLYGNTTSEFFGLDPPSIYYYLN